MNRYQLQRMQYVIRKIVKEEIKDSAPFAQVDALAEEVAGGFAAYLQVTMLGVQHARTIEIDVPQGRWQAIRAAFGLDYRRRKITINLAELFPKLSLDAPGNYAIDVEAN